MKSIENLFAENPVFKTLSPSKRDLLMQQAVLRRYKKGEVIAHLGDVWPYLFLVAEGEVNALKKSLEGRSLIVTTFARGDIFWGLAFFHEDMQMPVSLVVVKPTQLYLWPGERLHPLLKKEGEVSWELARLMIHKMTRASEILEDMAFQPIAGRMAKLLMETGEENEQGIVARSLTLDEMAARIGSTREMVCRFLHRIADEGIIDITRTEYRILDQERLAQIVQNARG